MARLGARLVPGTWAGLGISEVAGDRCENRACAPVIAEIRCLAEDKRGQIRTFCSGRHGSSVRDVARMPG
jgi:hypothetical protein